jgi:hypothetical protein
MLAEELFEMVKLRFEISIPGASLKKQKIGAGA